MLMQTKAIAADLEPTRVAAARRGARARLDGRMTARVSAAPVPGNAPVSRVQTMTA